MDFSAFDKTKSEAYEKQAKERWGNTDAYAAFSEKNKGRSEEMQEALARGLMTIFEDFGKYRNTDPAGEKAQATVKRLQAYISEHYYPCTLEILRSLGTMYAAGGDFTENIDAAGGEGTARFAQEAIEVYCR